MIEVATRRSVAAMTRAVLLVAAAVAAAVAWAGCGSDDSDERRSSSPEGARPGVADPSLRRLVTDKAIASKGRDSPERVLLSWFQALQYRDISAVELLSTKEAVRRARPDRIPPAVKAVSAAVGKPTIVKVRRSDRRAVIRVLVRAFTAKARKAVSSEPATFELARTGRVWRLADLAYLIETARAFSDAR